MVCRCGDACRQDAEGFVSWLRMHTIRRGHKATADLNRADCSPRAGCRRCGKPPGGRFTFYCGSECRDRFTADHWWGQARRTALKFERDPTARYSWAVRPSAPCVQADETCDGDPEVNHIVPVNGKREDWSCQNHQSGLEVLCHSHHVRETKAQRRDGRIGTPESAASLRASDAAKAVIAERRRGREAMNPKLI